MEEHTTWLKTSSKPTVKANHDLLGYQHHNNDDDERDDSVERTTENDVVAKGEIDCSKYHELGQKQDCPGADEAHDSRGCSLFGIEIAGDPMFDHQRQLEQSL